jgi:hypothetical protein
MRRPATVATRLRALVRSTERVLREAGELSEEYDAPALAAALGRPSQAREELRQAALVAQACPPSGGPLAPRRRPAAVPGEVL